MKENPTYHTAEEAFADVPAMGGAQTQAGSIHGIGAETGVYLRIFKDDSLALYRAFLQEAQENGWQMHVLHTRPLHDAVYTAVLKKDGRYLNAVHYITPGLEKTHVTVSPIARDQMWDAGALFDGVPLLRQEIEGGEAAADCGDNTFVKTVRGTDRAEYDDLLRRMEQSGFVRYADNGAGLFGKLFAADFRRDRRTVTVTHVGQTGATYLSAGYDAPLSPHLRDDPVWRKDDRPGAHTALHMPELWDYGNSFIVQLKNGHFVLIDGGQWCDGAYLADYLESLTPAWEKPVVEAWFISHGHADHNGALAEMGINPALRGRLAVEGVYFSRPSEAVMALDGTAIGAVLLTERCAKMLKTVDGETTPFYRPHTGERYYFSDVTVDVIMTQEQLPYEAYSGDFNDSSTWLLLTVEGQRILLGGDGDKGGMAFVMSAYSPEDMTVDVMSLLHHGFNVQNYFTDFCTVKTMLYTRRDTTGPKHRLERLRYLESKVEEYFSYGDGTRVLTFPYRVGESRCLPPTEWIYNADDKRP